MPKKIVSKPTNNFIKSRNNNIGDNMTSSNNLGAKDKRGNPTSISNNTNKKLSGNAFKGKKKYNNKIKQKSLDDNAMANLNSIVEVNNESKNSDNEEKVEEIKTIENTEKSKPKEVTEDLNKENQPKAESKKDSQRFNLFKIKTLMEKDCFVKLIETIREYKCNKDKEKCRINSNEIFSLPNSCVDPINLETVKRLFNEVMNFN